MQPVENSEHREYTCRFGINTKKDKSMNGGDNRPIKKGGCYTTSKK